MRLRSANNERDREKGGDLLRTGIACSAAARCLRPARLQRPEFSHSKPYSPNQPRQGCCRAALELWSSQARQPASWRRLHELFVVQGNLAERAFFGNRVDCSCPPCTSRILLRNGKSSRTADDPYVVSLE